MSPTPMRVAPTLVGFYDRLTRAIGTVDRLRAQRKRLVRPRPLDKLDPPVPADDFNDDLPVGVGLARPCHHGLHAIACNENGLSVFEMIRWRQHDDAVSLCAFDLLELDGEDLRSGPIETRKATLKSLLRPSRQVITALEDGRAHRQRGRVRMDLHIAICTPRCPHGRSAVASMSSGLRGPPVRLRRNCPISCWQRRNADH